MLHRVLRSTVIDAPVDAVWALLRNFNSHDRWHPAIAASRIEAGESPTRVGCVRQFELRDGHRVREQLLALDDAARRLSYCIVETTLPLLDYVAHVRLAPVTDGGRCFWQWRSSFALQRGADPRWPERVASDVYEAGFAGLRGHLQQRG